jgi:holo-[acyl-carrier protein] synthase
MGPGEGVVAAAIELTEVAEGMRLLAAGHGPFSAAEWAYARTKRDPERRLAARLAAKRAAAGLLGGVDLAEIEVLPARGGPPTLRLSTRAAERLRALGARRALVSLTHGVAHAAASVLLLSDDS